MKFKSTTEMYDAGLCLRLYPGWAKMSTFRYRNKDYFVPRGSGISLETHELGDSGPLTQFAKHEDVVALSWNAQEGFLMVKYT